jgi:hypothetical protein
MGWAILLKSNKEILEKDVDEIINSTEYIYKGVFCSKRKWGWSTDVDINKPQGNLLLIAGAHFSINKAEPATENIKRLLEQKGYMINKRIISL